MKSRSGNFLLGLLPRLVVNWAAQLIAADGIQAPEEFYFGSKVQEYLNG